MVKGLLADANIIGPVRALARRMQDEPWSDWWSQFGLSLVTFHDVGLVPQSKDVDVWTICQAHQLILITNNRNQKSSDSMEATIRTLNQPDSLPIFTISDLDKFQTDGAYADRVVEMLYDYLIRIDELRGTGRLFLP